jgi:acetyl-CoA/propionyl-CoA carboxylase carboxyl transferase subunit
MSADADPRDPLVRLSRLLDRNTATLLHDLDESGTCAVRGSIDGNKVFAYCTDARRSGGAMTALGCEHVIGAIDWACQEGQAVVGLWHSGGALLTEGVRAVGLVERGPDHVLDALGHSRHPSRRRRRSPPRLLVEVPRSAPCSLSD